VTLSLALLTLVLFSQSRRFEFINFDDPVYITGNPHVQEGLSLAGLAWAFGHLHGEHTYWHPITWVSHMVDCELFGLDPAAHHIVNVLLHTLATLLLFHVLRRMTGALWRSAMVAALFACHPLQADTVAWVTERKNILAGLFWLLTMLAYVRYAERSTWGRYAIVILCFALGLMSKPVLVTLPLVLLLVDFWPLQRLAIPKGPATNPASRNNLPAIPLKRAFLEKVPLLALSLMTGLMTIAAHEQLGTMMSAAELPLSARMANALVSYARYLLKTFCPVNLSVYYPMPAKWPPWQVGLSLSVILAISLAAILFRKRRAYITVGWFWFIGVLAPTIGVIQASTQAMADRFAYLPLIGFFIALVWGCYDCLPLSPRRSILAGGLALLALVAACAVTWHQLGYWQNSITLFTHALAVTHDNPVAHNNLGSALEAAGHPQEAISHYREAIRIKPSGPQAYNNLANALDDLGRSEEAIEIYQQALRLRPGAAIVHDNLGSVLAKQGRFEEARTNLLRALELKPGDAQACYLMGSLQLRTHNPRAAITWFENALQRKPDHLKALVILARLLAANEDDSVRNGSRASTLAEKAAALTGGEHPGVLEVLAMACAEEGRFDAAVKTEQVAVDMLKISKDSDALKAASERLALFTARKPYRETHTNLITVTIRP
jgi:tetratricopeptide (TPR) repeat protein